jgi:hypothetical protein
MAPKFEMRRRQPAETDEHVNRAHELPLGQGGLGRPDDALLQIPWPPCHVRERIVAKTMRRGGSVASVA